MAERAHPEDAGFRKWFGLRKTIYTKHLYRRYDFCKPYCRDKDVVDIPCGVGWGASRLKVCKSLVGIDISEEALEYGRQHYPGIRFLHGNMNAMPLDGNSVDVAVCLEGFEHIPKSDGLLFLQEAARVLRVGGIIILTTPVLDEHGRNSGNPYHLHECDEIELVKMLVTRFRFILYERYPGPDGPLVRFVGQTHEGSKDVERNLIVRPKP